MSENTPAGHRNRTRGLESVLFAAIGLVVGIVGTVVVTHETHAEQTARTVTVIQGPVATVAAPTTTAGARPCQHRIPAGPARHR